MLDRVSSPASPLTFTYQLMLWVNSVSWIIILLQSLAFELANLGKSPNFELCSLGMWKTLTLLNLYMISFTFDKYC